MERSSPHSHGYKLESQIREAFGRVVYTFTCHNKIVDRLQLMNNVIKISQIVLSAMTTGSFLVTIFSDGKISGIIGAILALILLMLNMYMKNTDLAEEAQKHQQAANLLWKIREEYVSLLTDFDVMDVTSIVQKRNDLQNRTAEVYTGSPRTDPRSYKKAQKALRYQEEQTFSEDEIDLMLANSIRRSNRQTRTKKDI